MKFESKFWLLDGSVINIKGKTFDDFLMELDNFFDIFKENVCYYLGSSDESIIEELKENEVNFEVESE